MPKRIKAILDVLPFVFKISKKEAKIKIDEEIETY